MAGKMKFLRSIEETRRRIKNDLIRETVNLILMLKNLKENYIKNAGRYNTRESFKSKMERKRPRVEQEYNGRIERNSRQRIRLVDN